MTTALFVNDNMSSTNELVTDSTVDALITAALVGFNAAGISLWDSATTYAALARVFRVGVVWETTAGVASGQPAPDVNNVDWKKIGDNHWLKVYDNEFIYAVGDKVFFDHPTLGATFWELITSLNVAVNDDFASDTVWTKGTGWTIAAGVATKAAGSASDLSQATILTDTVRFKITYTISGYVAGTATVKCGSGAPGAARSANGTFTEELVCSGSTDLILSANSTADYDIDDFTAIPAGIDPDDDEVKWQMMLIDTQITFYNELSGYASGKTVYYGLGTAAQNGVYKSNAAAALGEDPIDTSAKWDRQLMVTIDELTPTTTKGDLLVENATVLARLAVGADGLVLTADAASAEGVKWSAVAGTGDVVGPGSSTDERLVRMDGATGKLIQEATAIKVDDTDNITGVASIETPSIVTASNADMVLTPNGTGVIKMGKNFNTNNLDIISLSSQNVSVKPDTDGEFSVDFTAPTTAGLFRVKTSAVGKRLDIPFQGYNTVTTFPPNVGGVVLNLNNLDSTDGNYNVIQGRNDSSGVTSAIAFVNDSHASTNGSLHLFTNDASLLLAMKLSIEGHVTKPLTSAFNARLNATSVNATGNGTAVTIICGTEIYDQNADYATGTGIFTAPVDGNYNFGGTLTLDDVSNAVTHTSVTFNLVTSNRTYHIYSLSADALEDGNTVRMPWSIIGADMDASDTATINVTVSGATQIVDITGEATNNRTSFHGYLAF